MKLNKVDRHTCNRPIRLVHYLYDSFTRQPRCYLTKRWRCEDLNWYLKNKLCLYSEVEINFLRCLLTNIWFFLFRNGPYCCYFMILCYSSNWLKGTILTWNYGLYREVGLNLPWHLVHLTPFLAEKWPAISVIGLYVFDILFSTIVSRALVFIKVESNLLLGVIWQPLVP